MVPLSGSSSSAVSGRAFRGGVCFSSISLRWPRGLWSVARVWEAESSNPGRGTVDGRLWSSSQRQLGKSSPSNMQSISSSNLFTISPRDDVLNYRPTTSAAFELTTYAKQLSFRLL